MIGDALVLTMTRGVSLCDWHRLGLIEREWALYRRLKADYPRIVLVSGGDARDEEVAREHCPEATLVCNARGLSVRAWEREVPALVAGCLAGCERVLVKTNQMEGGRLAVAIVRALRQAGICAALLARGGYCWSRFVAHREGPASSAARAASREEHALCAHASLIACTSEQMADDLAWRYAIPRDRFRIVPNFVMGDEEEPVLRDPRGVLYAGQLIRRKRVDLLIDAMARPGCEGTLTIVGEGPEEDALRRRAREVGVEARFLRRVSHRSLRDLMRRSAIYAHASELEGHPKTIIEAMHAGCCVVAVDAPGTREVIEHERTGLLCAARAKDLGAAIGRVLKNPSTRERIGQAAREHARRVFGLDRIIEIEREAHRDALVRTDSAGQPAVSFEPALLDAEPRAQVRAFADAVGGFWKRLEPSAGARFVMGLDAALYPLHGHAAICAEGGLHPKHRLMAYHDFFCSRVGSGERVLDLGSGVGALAVAMGRRCGARVTGIDWDERNVERSRALAREHAVDHLVRFEVGDITRVEPQACDTIVLSNVLEHLRERAGLLARWRRASGCSRFLIRVPMYQRDWRVPYKRELGVEWRLDETHETEYLEEELRSELSEASLEVCDWITRWGEFWVEARSR